MLGLSLMGGTAALPPRHLAEEEEKKHLVKSGVVRKAFDLMMDVLTHPRCMDCHPEGDKPLQGNDSHPHTFGVKRGKEGRGTLSLKCKSCHKEEKKAESGISGAPDWRLVPRTMAWEGLSRTEISRLMTDPNKKGGRNTDQLVEHLTEGPLVMWAFDPGINPEGEVGRNLRSLKKLVSKL